MRFRLESGKELYYEIHGEGSPLLLLNGIMMSTASWQEFIEPFSAHHQLVLVDFLDQGQSDKVERPYDHQLQIDALNELVEGLGLEGIHLAGISYGGEIALQYAIAYPEKIKKLLLFNTCAETSYWLEEVGNAWNKASHDGEAYYLTTIPFIYSPLFFTQNKEWMEARKEKLLPVFSNPGFIESMRRLTDSSVGYGVKDQLHEINIPTLIVGSEYDFVTPFYQQEELHKEISDSELVFVPASGHAIMYEKPVLFTSLVTGFIQQEKNNFKF